MSALVVDTSAAFAVLTSEPGRDDLVAHLDEATGRLMSTATMIELGIVLEARLGPVAVGVLDRFVRDAQVEVVPLDRQQVDRALEGWRRFGKGRHRAKLNLGDCFAYALAATRGLPVLCTGSDFASTDLEVHGPR